MDGSGTNPASKTTSSEATADGSVLRVLLCEDEKGDYIQMRLHLMQLRDRSVEIDWARTLEQSFAALHRHAHDVALVDYRLIGGSGLDVLREAVAIGWKSPIILLTGLRDPSIDLKAMKLGASDFLTKDEIRSSVLERSIRYNIEKKRLEAAAAETNREMLRYIVKLREAKNEIGLQNRRIVSLAYHLASASHDEGQSDNALESVAPRLSPDDEEPLGIWNFDAQGRTNLANHAVLALLELNDASELECLSFDQLLSDDSRQRLREALRQLSPQAAMTIEVELIGQASGRRSWVVMSLLPAEAGSGDQHYLATIVDITSRRKVEIATRYLAKHDSLTGLANRATFNESLHHAATIARRNRSLVGLLCVDLDRFKEINDTLGHQAGDLLLRQVAERLCEVTRESDTVARLGGDEFGIIITNLGRYEDAATAAEKVVAALDVPFDLRGELVICRGSVGAAVFPVDCEDLEELFGRADSALYRMKRGRPLEEQQAAIVLDLRRSPLTQ